MGGTGLRGAIAVACGLGLAATASPAAGQCSTSTADTGFAEVVFSPSSATFDQVLPFDVPLRICAEAPGGTTRATVQFAAQPRRRGPLDVDPATCAIATPGVAWSAPVARIPTGTTVRWLVDRLEAQRYYVFCFGFEKQVTDAEAAAFRTRARAGLDAATRAVGSADLTADQTQALCQDLRDLLVDVAGADRIVDPGPLFACDPTHLASFAARVSRAVVEPQRRAVRILAGQPAAGLSPAVPSLGERQASLQADLAAIQADPALARLFDVADRQAVADPALAAKLAALCPGCPALFGAGATPASRLAAGEDATQAAAAPLDVDGDPARAAATAAAYGATAKALDGVRTLVEWALGAEGAATFAAGLTDAERSALATLAGDGGTLARASGRASTLAGVAQNLATQLAARGQALSGLADELTLSARDVVLADASTLGNFATRQTNYVALDAGMLWAPELGEIVPYLGTNLYLRPVNKNAPLATLGTFRQTFSRRFAFTFGLTGSSIAGEGSAAGQARDDLFGSQSLLAGAGVRLTDAMRVGAGALVFQRDDPSPLVEEEELYYSYYLTLSFDVDLARLFSGNLASALGVSAATPR